MVTPITQTKFHDPNADGKGNCLAAALASLLDFPLAAVPRFEDMGPEEWQFALYDWLRLLGLELDNCRPDDVPGGYAIANGMSPRGVTHSVVVKDGVTVHDPHPSGDGILGVREFWHIRPAA